MFVVSRITQPCKQNKSAAKQNKYLKTQFLTVVIHWHDASTVHLGHRLRLENGMTTLNMKMNFHSVPLLKKGWCAEVELFVHKMATLNR